LGLGAVRAADREGAVSGFIGAVVAPTSLTHSRHFGTGFSLFEGSLFVTARHVVESAERQGFTELSVLGVGLAPTPAVEVLCHPTSDVAVLVLPPASAVDPFTVLGEPEPDQSVSLLAFMADGVGRWMTTTVTGRAGRIGPPVRAYAFDAFELLDSPGPAYSGAPILSTTGALLGVLTHSAHHADGAERGIGLRLGAVETGWLADVVAGAQGLTPEGAAA
jgi:S1-C subfamily serine protease